MYYHIDMSKFKLMFSDYCHNEAEAGNCDGYDCLWCPVNMAWDKIFCTEQEDED